MPIKTIRSAAKAVSGVLDVNGDGVVNHHDAIATAKLVGAASAAAGATALASAIAGKAIIAGGAAGIASWVTGIAGAAAGTFVAGILGTTTTTTLLVAHVGSMVFIGASSVTSVSASVLAFGASAGAVAGQAFSGTIAGLPIIKAIALSNAVSAGEVIVVAGVPMGVGAALTAGLVAIIIFAGYAYYVLTKDAVKTLPATGEPPLFPA